MKTWTYCYSVRKADGTVKDHSDLDDPSLKVEAEDIEEALDKIRKILFRECALADEFRIWNIGIRDEDIF